MRNNKAVASGEQARNRQGVRMGAAQRGPSQTPRSRDLQRVRFPLFGLVLRNQPSTLQEGAEGAEIKPEGTISSALSASSCERIGWAKASARCTLPMRPTFVVTAEPARSRPRQASVLLSGPHKSASPFDSKSRHLYRLPRLLLRHDFEVAGGPLKTPSLAVEVIEENFPLRFKATAPPWNRLGRLELDLATSRTPQASPFTLFNHLSLPGARR
jgi:hypothetical protein